MDHNSFYRSRRNGRLSWTSRLAHSKQFIYIVVTCQLQVGSQPAKEQHPNHWAGLTSHINSNVGISQSQYAIIIRQKWIIKTDVWITVSTNISAQPYERQRVQNSLLHLFIIIFHHLNKTRLDFNLTMSNKKVKTLLRTLTKRKLILIICLSALKPQSPCSLPSCSSSSTC